MSLNPQIGSDREVDSEDVKESLSASPLEASRGEDRPSAGERGGQSLNDIQTTMQTSGMEEEPPAREGALPDAAYYIEKLARKEEECNEITSKFNEYKVKTEARFEQMREEIRNILHETNVDPEDEQQTISLQHPAMLLISLNETQFKLEEAEKLSLALRSEVERQQVHINEQLVLIKSLEDRLCPLLLLPNELISHTFSFLPVEDRLRARVSKRLYKIESETKYYVEKLIFDENSRISIRMKNHLRKECPFDFISNIAKNASIGNLQLEVPLSDQLHNLIEDFKDIRNLQLLIPNAVDTVNMMMDSFFLDLIKRSKSTKIYILEYPSENDPDDASLEVLHQVYKNFLDGNSNIHELEAECVEKETLEAFLNLIGIAYRDRQVFSNGNIEAYKASLYDDMLMMHLLYGQLEIRFTVDDNLLYYFGVKLIWHKTRESFEKAKKSYRMKRLPVLPL